MPEVDFRDRCKMDTDYHNMTIVELRALARARGLRGYNGLRKAGLMAFPRNKATPEQPVRPSNVHYDALRMLELTALARERGFQGYSRLKLQLHDAIYRLRSYSNSLIHILSLSNSHNNAASIQKNRDDKSHRVIVA